MVKQHLSQLAAASSVPGRWRRSGTSWWGSPCCGRSTWSWRRPPSQYPESVESHPTWGKQSPSSPSQPVRLFVENLLLRGKGQNRNIRNSEKDLHLIYIASFWSPSVFPRFFFLCFIICLLHLHLFQLLFRTSLTKWQQQILPTFTAQDARLHGGAIGHRLVGVDAAVGLLAVEEVLGATKEGQRNTAQKKQVERVETYD